MAGRFVSFTGFAPQPIRLIPVSDLRIFSPSRFEGEAWLFHPTDWSNESGRYVVDHLFDVVLSPVDLVANPFKETVICISDESVVSAQTT